MVKTRLNLPELSVPSFSVPKLNTPSLNVPRLQMPGAPYKPKIKEKEYVVDLGDLLLGHPISGTRELQNNLERAGLEDFKYIPLLNRALGAVTAVQDRIFKPYLEYGLTKGSGIVFINTLETLGNSLDTIANPVKALFPITGGGTGDDILRSMGWKEGEYRKLYQADTGNLLSDIALEIIMDPTNWLTFGGKALISEPLDVAVKHGDEVLETVFKNSDEVIPGISKDITKGTSKKLLLHTVDPSVNKPDALVAEIRQNLQKSLEDITDQMIRLEAIDTVTSKASLNQLTLQASEITNMIKKIDEGSLTRAFNQLLASEQYAKYKTVYDNWIGLSNKIDNNLLKMSYVLIPHVPATFYLLKGPVKSIFNSISNRLTENLKDYINDLRRGLGVNLKKVKQQTYNTVKTVYSKQIAATKILAGDVKFNFDVIANQVAKDLRQSPHKFVSITSEEDWAALILKDYVFKYAPNLKEYFTASGLVKELDSNSLETYKEIINKVSEISKKTKELDVYEFAKQAVEFEQANMEAISNIVDTANAAATAAITLNTQVAIIDNEAMDILIKAFKETPASNIYFEIDTLVDSYKLTPNNLNTKLNKYSKLKERANKFGLNKETLEQFFIIKNKEDELQDKISKLMFSKKRGLQKIIDNKIVTVVDEPIADIMDYIQIKTEELTQLEEALVKNSAVEIDIAREGKEYLRLLQKINSKAIDADIDFVKALKGIEKRIAKISTKYVSILKEIEVAQAGLNYLNSIQMGIEQSSQYGLIKINTKDYYNLAPEVRQFLGNINPDNNSLMGILNTVELINALRNEIDELQKDFKAELLKVVLGRPVVSEEIIKEATNIKRVETLKQGAIKLNSDLATPTHKEATAVRAQHYAAEFDKTLLSYYGIDDIDLAYELLGEQLQELTYYSDIDFNQLFGVDNLDDFFKVQLKAIHEGEDSVAKQTSIDNFKKNLKVLNAKIAKSIPESGEEAFTKIPKDYRLVFTELDKEFNGKIRLHNSPIQYTNIKDWDSDLSKNVIKKVTPNYDPVKLQKKKVLRGKLQGAMIPNKRLDITRLTQLIRDLDKNIVPLTDVEVARIYEINILKKELNQLKALKKSLPKPKALAKQIIPAVEIFGDSVYIDGYDLNTVLDIDRAIKNLKEELKIQEALLNNKIQPLAMTEYIAQNSKHLQHELLNFNYLNAFDSTGMQELLTREGIEALKEKMLAAVGDPAIKETIIKELYNIGFTNESITLFNRFLNTLKEQGFEKHINLIWDTLYKDTSEGVDPRMAIQQLLVYLKVLEVQENTSFFYNPYTKIVKELDEELSYKWLELQAANEKYLGVWEKDYWYITETAESGELTEVLNYVPGEYIGGSYQSEDAEVMYKLQNEYNTLKELKDKAKEKRDLINKMNQRIRTKQDYSDLKNEFELITTDELNRATVNSVEQQKQYNILKSIVEDYLVKVLALNEQWYPNESAVLFRFASEETVRSFNTLAFIYHNEDALQQNEEITKFIKATYGGKDYEAVESITSAIKELEELDTTGIDLSIEKIRDTRHESIGMAITDTMRLIKKKNEELRKMYGVINKSQLPADFNIIEFNRNNDIALKKVYDNQFMIDHFIIPTQLNLTENEAREFYKLYKDTYDSIWNKDYNITKLIVEDKDYKEVLKESLIQYYATVDTRYFKNELVARTYFQNIANKSYADLLTWDSFTRSRFKNKQSDKYKAIIDSIYQRRYVTNLDAYNRTRHFHTNAMEMLHRREIAFNKELIVNTEIYTDALYEYSYEEIPLILKTLQRDFNYLENTNSTEEFLMAYQTGRNNNNYLIDELSDIVDKTIHRKVTIADRLNDIKDPVKKEKLLALLESYNITPDSLLISNKMSDVIEDVKLTRTLYMLQNLDAHALRVFIDKNVASQEFCNFIISPEGTIKLSSDELAEWGLYKVSYNLEEGAVECVYKDPNITEILDDALTLTIPEDDVLDILDIWEPYINEHSSAYELNVLPHQLWDYSNIDRSNIRLIKEHIFPDTKNVFKTDVPKTINKAEKRMANEMVFLSSKQYNDLIQSLNGKLLNAGIDTDTSTVQAFYKSTDINKRFIATTFDSLKNKESQYKYLSLWADQSRTINGKCWERILLKEDNTPRSAEEINTILKEYDLEVVLLKQDKQGNPLVRKYHITNEHSLEYAKKHNAIIMPHELYRNAYLVVNKREATCQIVNLFRTLIKPFYTTIYLWSMGYLFRNAVDSLVVKNATATDGMFDIPKNVSYALRANRDIDRYSNMVKEIYKRTNETKYDKHAIRRYLKDLSMEDKQFYLFMSVYTNTYSSAGLPRTLSKYLIDMNLAKNADEIGDEKLIYAMEDLIFDNILTAPIHSITDRIEQSARLSLLYRLMDEGYTDTYAIRKLAETHFDYTLKDLGRDKVQDLFMFETYPIFNTLYYLNEGLTKNPDMLKLVMDAEELSYNNEQITWDDVRKSEYLMYNAMTGNLIVGDTVIKTGSSILEFLQTINDVFGSVTERFNPFIKAGLEKDVNEMNPFNAIPGRYNQIVNAFKTGGKEGSFIPSIYSKLYKQRKYGDYKYRKVYNSSWNGKYVPKARSYPRRVYNNVYMTRHYFHRPRQLSQQYDYMKLYKDYRKVSARYNRTQRRLPTNFFR